MMLIKSLFYCLHTIYHNNGSKPRRITAWVACPLAAASQASPSPPAPRVAAVDGSGRRKHTTQGCFHFKTWRQTVNNINDIHWSLLNSPLRKVNVSNALCIECLCWHYWMLYLPSQHYRCNVLENKSCTWVCVFTKGAPPQQAKPGM